MPNDLSRTGENDFLPVPNKGRRLRPINTAHTRFIQSYLNLIAHFDTANEGELTEIDLTAEYRKRKSSPCREHTRSPVTRESQLYKVNACVHSIQQA